MPGRTMAQRPLGTDVSGYQPSINWTNVHNAGVAFAWAKATEGTGYVNPYFTAQEAGAKNVGIYIGAYHYARPSLHPNITGSSSADSEAAYFWSIAGTYVKPGGTYLVPMLDWEDPAVTGGSFTTASLSAWVNEWCNAVSNYAHAAGMTIKPVVYTGTWYSNPANGYPGLNSSVTNWPDWIAAYPNNPQPQTGGPSSSYPWPSWYIWQYADTNWSGGDADVYHYDLASFVQTFVIGGGGPIISQQPTNVTIGVGSNAVFRVGVTGATPLYYQWRFDSADILGATNSTYSRTNVQLADGGSYSVVVSNSLSSVTSTNAVLTVLSPPVITTQPQSVSVTVGQGASLSVAAQGTAPLSYQWLFNSNNIAAATNASLIFASAQSANYGLYSVVVSNRLGRMASSNALLAVIATAAWGDSSWGQTNGPVSLTNVIAVAGGAWHSLALRADGTVLAWGDDINGQCDVPAGLNNALAIAAGGYHSLAIRSDGRVTAWGNNDYGQSSVPAGLGQVIGVGAGAWHSLVLGRDGTVTAWGDNSFGQCNVPAGLSAVVAVAAGGNHSLALRADGTVAAWGDNTGADGTFAGESVLPEGLNTAVGIAAGDYHSLAVRADGTVVGWGDDSQGQIDVPPGLSNVVAVAAGGAHSLALQRDGTVLAWGANWNSQCNLPGLTNVVAVSAGEDHSMALVAGNVPALRLLSPARQGIQFSALVQSLYRKTYAFDSKPTANSSIWTAFSTNSGNGALLLFADPNATTPAKYYRLRQW